MNTKEIVEKRLGISPDYQYKAMRKSFWAKQNWHKNKFNAVKLLTKFNRKLNVLDLGTGSGNFELLFADKVNKIYGIDYNDEALNFLKTKIKKRKIKNVFLECSDMRKLSANLSSKKYDLIVSIDTIEHISSKDGRKVLKWVKSRLNPHGSVLIITPNYKSIWTILEPILDIFSFTPNMGLHQHLSKYSVDSMSKKLLRLGFKIKSKTSFNLFSFIFPAKINDYLLNWEIKNLSSLGPLMLIVATKN
jgi:2-polyprenyl-3-methyl-5-hydroxy-6-metoxy-1,4-benzoquinol methylase